SGHERSPRPACKVAPRPTRRVIESLAGVPGGGLCASPSDLLAGPRLLQNLQRECLEALVHPFRALIDVGDHDPDGLAHGDALGHADVKARAAEIEYGLNNSRTQTLAKRLAVFT